MEKRSMFQETMLYGIIIGAVGILFSVILYMAGFNIMDPQDKTVKLLSYLNYPILLLLLWWAQTGYRKKACQGVMSYGKGVAFGALAGLWTGVLNTIFMALFIWVLEPNALNAVYDYTEVMLEEQGLSSSDIETAIEMTKKFTPIMTVVGSLFGGVIGMVVLSLITSIFSSRKAQPPVTPAQ